jgi:hypothetical protein
VENEVAGVFGVPASGGEVVSEIIQKRKCRSDSPTPCSVRIYIHFRASEKPVEIQNIAIKTGQKNILSPCRPTACDAIPNIFLENRPLVMVGWSSRTVLVVIEGLEPTLRIEKGIPNSVERPRECRSQNVDFFKSVEQKVIERKGELKSTVNGSSILTQKQRIGKYSEQNTP